MSDIKIIDILFHKENISENKEENLKLITNELPDNVKFLMKSLSGELEDLCDLVNSNIILFFKKPENNLEYGIIVVKVMEYVDNIKSLSGGNKYIVAARCIIIIIKKEKSIPDDIKNNLIITIPGLIEAVIQLTKGEALNRNIKGLNMIESSYVIKRSVERIIEYIKSKKYDLLKILENIFMIVTQIMYIVGSYPSLNGIQKKEIVIEVIQIIITKYRDTETDMKVPDLFINMVLYLIPSVINTLVSVSEGVFNINKVNKCFSSCIICC